MSGHEADRLLGVAVKEQYQAGVSEDWPKPVPLPVPDALLDAVPDAAQEAAPESADADSETAPRGSQPIESAT